MANKPRNPNKFRASGREKFDLNLSARPSSRACVRTSSPVESGIQTRTPRRESSSARGWANATIRSRGGTTLANLSAILKQLKKERAQVERQLWGLDAAIRAFASVYTGAKPARKRRKMSAKSRAKIAAAQRRRWAKVRKSKNV